MARYWNNLPTLKSLSSLPIADLKKILRAYRVYEIKKEKYQSERAFIEAKNLKIDRQNAQATAQKEQWEKQYTAPLHAEISRIDLKLRECSVGFFAQFVADSFEFEGGRYKTNPGRMLVQQRIEIQKRIDALWRSKPSFNLLPEEYTKTRSPKKEANLKIGGATLKIYFESLDIEQLENLIEVHEQKQADEKAKVTAQRANEKAKVMALRARVTSSEKEIREQAKKFKRDLHKQVAKVPCCPYCGGSITDNNVHLDHIWPVSKGGQSSAKNLVFVCESCNINKSNLTLRSFIMKFQLNALEVHNRLELLEKDF